MQLELAIPNVDLQKIVSPRVRHDLCVPCRCQFHRYMQKAEERQKIETDHLLKKIKLVVR